MSAFHQEVVGAGGESIVTLDLQSSVIKESDLQSETIVMKADCKSAKLITPDCKSGVTKYESHNPFLVETSHCGVSEYIQKHRQKHIRQRCGRETPQCDVSTLLSRWICNPALLMNYKSGVTNIIQRD